MNKSRLWTDKEKQFLKKFYPAKGSKYVADNLGRNRAAIISKAHQLGLDGTGNMPFRLYTPKEILIIKKYYPQNGSAYVGKMLGRSPASIRYKARKLKVERNIPGVWSAEELEYLLKSYKKKRPSEIARNLNRSTGAVLVRARMLGLFKKFSRRWTNDEELYLIKNFRSMRYKQIGRHLNRTERSIQGKLGKMKMIKMPERDWKPAEKRLLTRFYGKKPVAEIANRLNRTSDSIKGRAGFQKLKKKRPPGYTEKEKNFIRENYLKMTNEQIAKKLKRKKNSIARMGMKLGLVGTDDKKQMTIQARKDLYNDKEKEFIRKNYLKMTNKEIAKKLNRPAGGIIDIACRLGISGKSGKRQLWIRGNTETHYTEEEKIFIRRNYLKMTNEQIAEKLTAKRSHVKRSAAGVACMISKLGLSGHPERRANMKKIRRRQSK